jgi:hypothetical protein
MDPTPGRWGPFWTPITPEAGSLFHAGQHFGGQRRDPDQVKREGWHEQGVLAVSADDQRLTWLERELIRQLSEKLYGQRPIGKEIGHG